MPDIDEGTAGAKSAPKLNPEQMRAFGQRMFERFGKYKADRRTVELGWLQSLRQFKGIYDPNVAIPEERSRAYPKITRHKVVGTVARLMEMLFSATGRNWDAQVSTIPDLPEDVANGAIAAFYADYEARAAEAGGPLPEPTQADVEKALFNEAKKRAERMRSNMDDQLEDMDYVTIARKVVLSATIYGAGVMKGPLTRKVSETVVRRDPASRRFKAMRVDRLRPYFEFLPIWSYYPDMTAKSHTPDAMDGHFERHALTAAGLKALKGEPGFIDENIDGHLREFPDGNYKEAEWEQQIRSITKSASEGSDRQNVGFSANGKHELAVWWGNCLGRDLAAAGVENVDETEVYEGNVWIVGHRVIKAIVSPLDSERFKRKIRPAHVFIFEEDDISVFGTGLPPIMRDSQLAIANAARMLLDNASVVTGPNVVVDTYALVDGQDINVHAWKVWVVDHSKLSNGRQPVYQINFDSHIGELERIIRMFQDFSDAEVSLPSSLQGVIKGGSEAYRTTTNTTALLSAAAMPIRDTVRNFDKFTESAMLALYLWNDKFGDDPLAKGDFSIVTRGATTLIAKEARANSLDYLAQTMTEDERLEINPRKFLEERMRGRDVTFDVLDDPDVVDQRRRERGAVVAAQQADQSALVRAQVKETLASAMKQASVAMKASTDANTRALEVVLRSLTDAVQRSSDEPAAEPAAAPA